MSTGKYLPTFRKSVALHILTSSSKRRLLDCLTNSLLTRRTFPEDLNFVRAAVRTSYRPTFALPTHIFTFQTYSHVASLRDVDVSLDLFRRLTTGVGTWCVGVPMHTIRSQNFLFFFLLIFLNFVLLESNSAVNLQHYLSMSFLSWFGQ